jgi:putative spermidine/putrescine transport system permease protein
MSLGAGPAKTLWYVTLPLIKPGLFAAGLFSFIVSFDNFSMTMFLVTTRETLPVAIYSYIKTQDDPTIAAVSTLLLLLTVAVLIFTERYIGLKGLLKQ